MRHVTIRKQSVHGIGIICGKRGEPLWVLRSGPAIVTVSRPPARLRSANLRHRVSWKCGSWLPSLVSPMAGARLLSVIVARFSSWGPMSGLRSGAPPYFPFYPNDYLGSQRVQIMSMAERGLYQTLLAFDWNGFGLPIEVESLAKLTGLDRRTFKQLWPKVEPCFPVKDGRRYNPRLEIEREKADERSHSARNAAAMRWQSLPSPSPEPSPLPATTKATTTTRSPSLAVSVEGSLDQPSNGKQPFDAQRIDPFAFSEVRIIDNPAPVSVDKSPTSTRGPPDATPNVHSASLPACGDTKPAQSDQCAVDAPAVSDKPSPRKHSRPSSDAFTPEFERAWANYPKRQGTNSRQDAWRSWCAAVSRGADPAELGAGVLRYAKHQAAERHIGTPFVMQAERFFGPGEHWRESWAVAGPLGKNTDPKPACVHCGGNGDLMSYDRKPIHARCLDAWQLGQQGAMDSARRAS